MKKLIALLLTLLLMLCLCSCGAEPEPEAAEQTESPEQTVQTAQPETQSVGELSEVYFELEDFPEEAMQQAHIYGLDADSQIRWQYDTEKLYVSELEDIQEIGTSVNGYMFIADGTVYCMSLWGDTEGQIIWQNDDFGGASASWAFDNSGNLYLCGYYGPALMIIDGEGKTVSKFPQADDGGCFGYEDCFWPDTLEYYDDDSTGTAFVDIHYLSNDEWLRVDANTGEVLDFSGGYAGGEEYFVPDTSAGIGATLAGTWGTSAKDADFTITFGEGGSYFASRYDYDEDCWYYYSGDWYLGYWDKSAEDCDWLLLPMNTEADDPLAGQLGTLGEFQIINVYEENGMPVIEFGQLNNGDSIFSIYYETYSPVLYKINNETAMG